MEKERKASKQNKGIFGTLCILLIMLLLTGTGGYTYARYMTQERGTGGAEIADWAFEIAKDGEQTKTVKLVNTANKETLVNGKIAPGTSGEFTITLDATGSEVGVDYTLAFMNEVNRPKNITFTYGERKYQTLTQIGDIKGTINATGTKTKSITIKWEWAYQTGSTTSEISDNDKIDTQDGTSLLDYAFDIYVLGTQSK